MEDTGSLTGHIMRISATDTGEFERIQDRSGSRRAILILAIAAVVLIGAGALAMVLTHGSIGQIFTKLFEK